MSDLKKPNSLATKADCEQLAAYEWAHELGDEQRELWEDRATYLASRTSNLAGRLKPTTKKHSPPATASDPTLSADATPKSK